MVPQSLKNVLLSNVDPATFDNDDDADLIVGRIAS
jgi:hypothetical protein